MDRITKLRAQIMILLFAVVLGIFAFTLYDLQIIKTGGNTNNVSTFTTYTTVKAARGNILDRNGNKLVGNRASYDLVLNHFVIKSAVGTNKLLYQLVKRCQEQNLTYNEHFPISKERPFVYTLQEQSPAWQGYFQKYLAYLEGLDSDITAPLLIERLREIYEIPEEWTEEEARLVLGIWYELDLRGCVQSLSNYVFMADVDDAELSAVVELNIPGMNVEHTTVREYDTKYAAHILGFVGPMNAEQWEKYKDVEGYSMDAEIGQDGLEAAFEEYLHGVDGLRADTVTKDGTLISSEYIKEPKAGSNVEITIDLNLQMAAEDTLSSVMKHLRNQKKGESGADAQGAAVVAMDTRTGKVLVCASYPTYDPSKFFENYEDLLEEKYDPLFNRALLGTYPPGSTYKMSMVIAGIDSGVISSKSSIYCRGVYQKYAPAFAPKCLRWTNYKMIHQGLTPSDALMYSCNYFFYELGDRIRLSAMDKTAKGLGLGERTGIELPEYIGYRANKETKKEKYTGEDAEWYQADQITAAIGQSDNQFTPMQLCSYTATLANKGTRYKATLLNRVVSADYRKLLLQNEATVLSHMDISNDAYKTYSEGMRKVAHSINGTAYKVFKNYPIPVAAKTGTAQTGSLKGSDNGAFVCYAPAGDNPEIAIAVYGEKAGHGSDMGTVAKAILDSYFSVGEVGDVDVNENQLS